MYAILCVPVLACFGPIGLAIAIHCMLYTADTDVCMGTVPTYILFYGSTATTLHYGLMCMWILPLNYII